MTLWSAWSRHVTCATFLRMSRLHAVATTGLLAVILFVAPATAPTSFEVVHFAAGGTMPIAAHRIDGDAIVLELRGGTHLVLTPGEQLASGPAYFDLMVDDLDAAHEECKALG